MINHTYCVWEVEASGNKLSDLRKFDSLKTYIIHMALPIGLKTAHCGAPHATCSYEH